MTAFVVVEGEAAVGDSPGDLDQPGALGESEERTACSHPRSEAGSDDDSRSQKATWDITLAPKTFIGGVVRVVIVGWVLEFGWNMLPSFSVW